MERTFFGKSLAENWNSTRYDDDRLISYLLQEFFIVKVCIFAGNFSSEEMGGGYTFESQLLLSLAELASVSKHELGIFSQDSNSVQPLAEVFEQSAVKKQENLYLNFKNILFERVLSPRVRSSLGLISPLKIWRKKNQLAVLKSAQIDVILSLSPACLSMEIPYIVVVWDLQHRRQPYFPEVSIGGEWGRREKYHSTMLRRASVIITGTEVGKTEISQFYQVPLERIEVIPFPTPKFVLEPFDQNDSQVLEKFNLPENYLFYPAQFWPHKNHAGVLQAVKLVDDQYGLKLPVVFSGSDKGNQSYIKQLADELGLTDRTYFTDFVSRHELIALYRNAMALIFITFFGPDNLPPLEAMALGCPVIASNVPGAEEQLGDAALLVDPKSPERIATAMQSVWTDNTLRHALIQRGYERVSQWSVKDYVAKIFSILDDFESIRQCWK